MAMLAGRTMDNGEEDLQVNDGFARDASGELDHLSGNVSLSEQDSLDHRSSQKCVLAAHPAHVGQHHAEITSCL